MRNPYFDNAKAVLIVLVVAGHLLQLYVDKNINAHWLFVFIYLFHMAAFSLLSGYFSKKLKNVPKSIVKYLVLFIVCTFIFYPFAKINILEMLISPFFVLWYLVALALWYLLLQVFRLMKHPITIAFVVAVLAGYVYWICGIMALSRTLAFFPFFLIGYYAKKEDFIRLTKYRIPAAIILSAFAAAARWLDFDSNFLLCNVSYAALSHTEWYAGLHRLLILLCSLVMTACFFAVVPKKRSRFTQLGQYTLYIFLGHGLILTIFGLYV